MPEIEKVITVIAEWVKKAEKADKKASAKAGPIQQEKIKTD